jgi:hypothetical protein
MDAKSIINKTFDLEIGNLDVSPTYWQAATIVFLLFLLVWTFARIRYLYVHWSLGKSSIAMLFWGFLLALILEGFLILGGRTMFTEVLGWESAPKPISTALDMGRNKLVDVLGITDEIPESTASEKPTYQRVVGDYQGLTFEDKKNVKNFICQP